MDKVWVVIDPEMRHEDLELLERHLSGKGWEAWTVSIDEIGRKPPASAAVVVATDWADGQLGERLTAVRAAVGPRRGVLALLPKPPASYPAETQVLWNRALGYGHRFSEIVAIVDDFLAGRL